MEPDGTRGAFRPFFPTARKAPRGSARRDVFPLSTGCTRRPGAAPTAFRRFSPCGEGSRGRVGRAHGSPPSPAGLLVARCGFAGDVSGAPYLRGAGAIDCLDCLGLIALDLTCRAVYVRIDA